jgi:hypothetical protein
MLDDLGEEVKLQLEKDYIFHFFFVHGLYDTFFHIQAFTEKIDKIIKDQYDLAINIDEDKSDPVFNDKVQFGSVFPSILYKSIFLHIYAVMESSLVEICNNLRKLLKADLMLYDISGRGIKKSEKYLKKVIKIDFPSDSKHWKALEDYSKIRNVLIHSDGLFPNNNKEFSSLLTKYRGLNLHTYYDENNYITLEKEFVLDVLENVRNFFLQLQKEMNKLK